jgi:hypothetical protein
MTDGKHRKPAPAIPIRVHPDVVMAPPHSDDAEPMPEPDAAHPEETATGIVASGHSVHVSTGEKIACGYDAMLARPVYRQAFTVAGPGEVVTLPKSEVAKLMAAGFLVDPDRLPIRKRTDA